MRRSGWMIAVGLSAALAAGAAGYQSALADRGSTKADLGAVSDEKLALEAQDRLRHEQLEAQAADPAKKQAAIDAKAADALAGASERKADAVGSEADAWPEGIFEDTEAPAPGSRFLGTNRWVGSVNGGSVAVYAGLAGEDQTIGRLLVIAAGSSMSIENASWVDLPGAGRLRIVSALASAVTVADSRGGVHVFDAAAKTWVS